MTMHRIVGTKSPSPATADESLRYVDGDEKTIFLTHPHGTRAARRSKQRHFPYFTKTRTRGRLWRVALRDSQRAKNG